MPINLLNENDLNKYLTKMVYFDEEVPHWVSDKSSESQKNLQSPDWVKEHKDEVVKAILLQYFKKRMREYLTENSDASFLTPVNKSEKNLPEWCEIALNNNKPVYKFDDSEVSSDLKEKISVIRDYLYAMADKYVSDTAKLAKKTEKKSKIRLDFLKTNNELAEFDMVLSAAELWHEKLANNSKKTRKDEAFYQKSLKGTEFVMELPNNAFAYKLLTREALEFEGNNMGHCVGSGFYEYGVRNGVIEIYSIRDENGEPHVTFEIRNENGEFYTHQCKGKQNKAPVQKYMDAVKMLIAKMNWNIGGDAKNMGLFKVSVKVGDDKFENKIYSFPALIDGSEKIEKESIYNCSLDLSDRGLTKLPDLSNLIVKGDFFCSYNQLTSLEGAPKEVGGNFFCSNNQLTSLKGAPEKVGGDFFCSNNQLTSLEGAPKEVGVDFSCSNNQLTSLKGASKEVGGDFVCSHNQLTSLEGAPEKVGGNFYCSNNQLTSLEGAPKEVVGRFECENNKLTDLRGAPKEVGRYFFCSHNQLTNLQGAPEKVGDSFNCSNNQLTSLEGAPKEVGTRFECENNQLTDLRGAPEKVGGGFYCPNNQLKSLEGAPKEVGGNFYCPNNQLTDLRGAPEKVGGDFSCSSNQLTSLEGAPKEVGGNFICKNNPKLRLITKLPTKIGGEFIRDEDNSVENIKKLINKNWR